MMHWTWILTALSITGVILNIKKKKVCFYIWLFTNATWMVVDFRKGIPAQGFLFMVYTLLAIWGIWEWRKTPINDEPFEGVHPPDKEWIRRHDKNV